MIRHVLLISSSGTVLFEHEFKGGAARLLAQPRLTGSLLTAILSLCDEVVGSRASYVELSSVSLSVCADVASARSDVTSVSLSSSNATSPRASGVICAVFHDAEDGEDFGRIVALQMLRSFVGMHSSELTRQVPVVAVGVFGAFAGRLREPLRNCALPVLEQLQGVRGVEKCVLSDRHHVIHATSSIEPLSFVANLNPLMSCALDLLSTRSQPLECVVMDYAQCRVFVAKVAAMHLTVVCRLSVASSHVQLQVTAAAGILQRVLKEIVQLSGNLSVESFAAGSH